MEPGDRLRAARERAGKSHQELADAAGISRAHYYDLEGPGNELTMTISLAELHAICKSLGIQTRDLFEDKESQSQSAVNFAALSDRLRAYLRDRGMLEAAFEEMVGWSLGGFADNPEAAWKWNVDCLREVCGALHVDWISTLPR